MNKTREILRLKLNRKFSHRNIGNSLNISAATVTNYVKRAKYAVITSWTDVENMSDKELHHKLFAEQEEIKPSNPSAPTEIDCDQIDSELRKKGVTRLLLWQEYKAANPKGIGYTQFCEKYKHYKEHVDPVMRQVHQAGEEGFVDYAGTTMPFIDPATGEILKAQIFIGCLGASNYTYVEATRSQKTLDWLGSTKRTFEFWGGVPEKLVPDNLKSGVTKADRYDPDLNPAYQEFGRYYNVAIMPARPVHPRDKASAESAVHFVTTQIIAPLRNKQFYSLGALNEAIWERLKILNHKSFQKKDTSRYALFETVDKPALQPLPAIPYEYADWKKVRINIDYHFAYDNHYYSVPYIHCKKQVMIRVTSKTIECFLDNERIAVHTRSYEKYKHTTLEAHMPQSHQEQAKYTPEMLAVWAKRIGPNTSKLLTVIIESKDFPQQGMRPCLGILRLSNTHGADRLEKACAKALLVGMTRQPEIKYMLKNNLENMPIETVAKSPPKHENIRGAQYYQKLLTKGELAC